MLAIRMDMSSAKEPLTVADLCSILIPKADKIFGTRLE